MRRNRKNLRDTKKEKLIREMDQNEFWELRGLTECERLILCSYAEFVLDFELERISRWTQLEFDFVKKYENPL